MTLTLPTPVLPDPDAVPALRWGVIGTGIAGKFVTAIHRHTPQRAIAVTARDAAKTSAFAAEHGIDRTVSSVEALVTDPEVDVVYVATPHPLHREQALAAIAAGKHVLIEKPIAMSAAEAQEITGAGRAAGVLVMEAMWTRYLPQSDIMRRLLADSTIGTVRLVNADFGFVMPYEPGHRLWAPELGGGALLDAGVYPISFAASVLGSPTACWSKGRAVRAASTCAQTCCSRTRAEPGRCCRRRSRPRCPCEPRSSAPRAASTSAARSSGRRRSPRFVGTSRRRSPRPGRTSDSRCCMTGSPTRPPHSRPSRPRGGPSRRCTRTTMSSA
ncbi:Gfo/Idh/MocA family protein [Curtobacterium sp. 24E2]